MKSLFPALAAMALFLQACSEVSVEAENSVPRQSVSRHEAPDYLYSWGLNQAIAEVIAEQCRSIGLRTAAINNALADVEKRAKADGYSPSDIRAMARNRDRKKVQDDLIAYINSRDIVFSDRKTICAAGHLEIAENTQIGTLLRAK